MRTFFLIDGHNLIHRCFHALMRDGREPDPEMIADATERTIRAWLRAEGARPDRTLIVFDGEGGTAKRRAVYPDYKAQRGQRSKNLTIALHGLMPNLSAAGLRTICVRGWEADDQIATLVHHLAHPPEGVPRRRAAILTTDKDLWQLLGPGVAVHSPARQGAALYPILTETGFVDRWGFPPALWPDYRALVGDPSDNIRGVDGIGPVNAAALLTKFDGGLESVLGAVRLCDAGIRPHIRAALTAGAAVARRNLRLTTLRRDVPGLGELVWGEAALATA